MVGFLHGGGPLLLSAIAFLGLTGCGPIFGLQDARTVCDRVASSYGAGFKVSGVFVTDVRSLRRLQPEDADPALWSGAHEDEPGMLCYLDGELAKDPPLGLEGEVRDPFNRSAVGIVDGDVQLIAAGYQHAMPIRAP